MSELPEGWVEADLHELLADGPTNGFSPPSGADATGTPTLKLTATTSGCLRLDEDCVKRVYQDIAPSSKYWLEPGDVLVQRANSLEYVGATAIFDGPRATYIYPDLMMRLRPRPELDRHYLWRYLNGETSKLFFRENATGTAGNMPKISGATLKRLPLLVPPINEQRRIVEKIEALTARSRRAKEALDAVPALLDKLRQSILAAAFRGDLTADWRAAYPNAEPASVLLERIRTERRRRWEEAELAKMQAAGKPPKNDSWKSKYQDPEPVDTEGLPELPEGWAWASVGEMLAEPLANGRSVQTREGGFPVLRLTCLTAGGIDLSERKEGNWSESEARPFLVHQGDFLVARGNGSLRLVGRGGLVTNKPDPVAFPDTLIRIRPHEYLRSDYLARAWESRIVREQIERVAKTTAGIFKVSQSDLESLVLPIPPLDEQAQIVRSVARLFNGATSVRTSYDVAAAAGESLNSAILAKAFRGELVPQDPNDEPASVLLERIRAERAVPAPKPTAKARTPKKRKASPP